MRVEWPWNEAEVTQTPRKTKCFTRDNAAHSKSLTNHRRSILLPNLLLLRTFLMECGKMLILPHGVESVGEIEYFGWGKIDAVKQFYPRRFYRTWWDWALGPISPSAVNSQSGVKQAILPHPNLTKCGGVKSMPSKLPHAVKPILPHFCGKTEGFLPRYRRTEANNQLFAADFTPNANWFYGTISAVKQRTEAKWSVMNRRIFRPRINTDQDLSPAKFR